MDRTANLLHAMATAIADRQLSAMTETVELSPTAIAVVLTLGQYTRQSLTDLATITALSHSATVRLVDRLEQEGLVERGKDKQGRSVPVSLTATGQETYTRLRRKQSEALTRLLDPLSQDDKNALTRVAERLLTQLTDAGASRDHICRYCDEAVCIQTGCPVEISHQKQLTQQ